LLRSSWVKWFWCDVRVLFLREGGIVGGWSREAMFCEFHCASLVRVGGVDNGDNTGCVDWMGLETVCLYRVWFVVWGVVLGGAGPRSAFFGNYKSPEQELNLNGS